MKKLAVLLATAAVASTASAATISYNFTKALQTTEISQTGNLGLFDTTLGTLTGVSLVLSGSNSTLLSLTNNAANSQTTRATSTTDLFFGSSLDALHGILAAANPEISLAVTTGFVTLASGATQNFGPLTDSGTRTFGPQFNGILASFGQAGGGEFAVNCNSLSGIAILGGGGNIASNQATEAGCGAAIEYTYTTRITQVPEPGSLALMSLAIAGLGFAARRRKA